MYVFSGLRLCHECKELSEIWEILTKNNENVREIDKSLVILGK